MRGAEPHPPAAVRAAMAELRHLLGLLSPVSEAVGEDGLAAPAAAELQPQPGVRQLASLIGRVRAAGLAVSYREGGTPPDLAPGLDLTVYRIVRRTPT